MSLVLAGVALLAREEGFCAVVGRGLLATSTGDTWQVLTSDDEQVVTVRGQQPPTATTDLLVGITRDGDVVAHDRAAGQVRWRRSTGLRDGWVRAVPGFGIIATTFDDELGAPRSQVFDEHGRPRSDSGIREPSNALYLEQDGRGLAVTTPFGRDGGALLVRDLADGTTLGGHDLDEGLLAGVDAVTGRGVLATDLEHREISLLRWPDLRAQWTAPLPDADDDGGDLVLASSASAVVVVTTGGDGAVLHAYS